MAGSWNPERMNDERQAMALKVSTGQLHMHVQVSPARPTHHVAMVGAALAFGLMSSLAVLAAIRFAGMVRAWMRAEL